MRTLPFISSLAASGFMGLSPATAWTSPGRSCVSKLSPHPGRTSRLFATLAGDTLPKRNTINQDNLGKEIAQGAVVSRMRGLVALQVDAGSVELKKEETAGVDLSAPPKTVDAVKQSSGSVAGDLLGHHVVLPGGEPAVVVCHRPPLVFCYHEAQDVPEGMASVLDSLASIAVPELKGKTRALFSAIPKVSEIALINNPMLTGITMVDALAPIGRGQNMLLIGHDADRMRGMAVDFLSQVLRDNDKEEVRCVYAAIDDSSSSDRLLQDAGIHDDVYIVENQTVDTDPVALSVQAVSTAAKACAVAELFALNEPHRHSVVVIDTIDQHKVLWDLTTRVLVDVFGADAVVKGDLNGSASSEMRAYYSSLIQRAAQFNAKKGSGSVTLLLLTQIPKATRDKDTVFEKCDFDGAGEKIRERIVLLTSKKIPLTAANLQKIGIPVPSESEGKRRLVLQHVEDLISMSDGQIWFDEALEESGQQPPLDPQRSVTRVGIGAATQSRADAPALRRIVERLRLELSQAASMDGANMGTTASQKQLRRKNALLLAMHQQPGEGGRGLSDSCVALLAATEGFLDAAADSGAMAGTDQGKELMDSLFLYVRAKCGDYLEEIDATMDTSDEARESLKQSIEAFFAER